MQKRQFLKKLGGATLASTIIPMHLNANTENIAEPYPKSNEEAFWKRIRKDYLLKPDYINLENGYYNLVPTPILNKYMEHIKAVFLGKKEMKLFLPYKIMVLCVFIFIKCATVMV